MIVNGKPPELKKEERNEHTHTHTLSLVGPDRQGKPSGITKRFPSRIPLSVRGGGLKLTTGKLLVTHTERQESHKTVR